MSESETKQVRQAIQRRNAPDERRDLFTLVESEKPRIVRLMGSEQAAEAFITAMYTDWKLRPDLLACDPVSLIGGARLAAQLGLPFGPLGLVYLVPRNLKSGGKWATFVLGYRGMIQLAYNSGRIKKVEAHVVREGDEFAFQYGTAAKLTHVPVGPPGEREWTHVYAVAATREGGTPFTVLYPEDVAKRRARSAAGDSPFSPWQTEPAQMWRKSAVRDLQRFLPQTPQLALADQVDELDVPPEEPEAMLGEPEAE